jgi:hypothetical protein
MNGIVTPVNEMISIVGFGSIVSSSKENKRGVFCQKFVDF